MSGRDDKASRYISLLDEARCEGRWIELPELIRKVQKHAPQKNALTTIAACELAAVDYARSSKSISKNINNVLDERIRELSILLAGEKTSSDEVVHARTCLAWIHWLRKDLDQVLATLQGNYTELLHHQTTTLWTYVCLVKAAYFQTASVLILRQDDQLFDLSETLLASIEIETSRMQSNSQVLYWTEQLLGQLAVSLSQHCFIRGSRTDRIHSTLEVFRKWSTFAAQGEETAPLVYGNSSTHLSRLSIWQADYNFVSEVLSSSIEYPASDSNHRPSQQAMELQRVQTMYENELLRSVSFPHASETNSVVEEWVEQAVQNWQRLCDDQRREDELGEGGRNRWGRNLLEILYRAAGKTFQSTLILRRLFQVHKALADFSLAYKALDTYVELMERDRARAAKISNGNSGHDNGEIVLRALAEGVEGLCAYGGKDEAERAYELSQKLISWLDSSEEVPNQQHLVNGHAEDSMDEKIRKWKESVSPATRELALRAIGIAQAHWALWTPVNEDRATLQSHAISIFHRALQQPTSDDQFLGSTYALSLVLARARDVDSAMTCLTEYLMSRQGAELQQDSRTSRKLLPLWHLLGLLLTSQQDFNTATQACAAAFDQLPALDASSNADNVQSITRNLLSVSPAQNVLRNSFLDNAECDELQSLIEVRITELALTELRDGPEDAVNSCNILLSQFSRLFKRFGVAVGETTSGKHFDPPQSSATTVKSFRGSIFGKKKMSRLSEDTMKRVTGRSNLIEKVQNRPPTQSTNAPTIQVTDEDEKSPTHKHRIFRRSEDRQIGAVKTSPKIHRPHGSLSKVFHSPTKDQARTSEKSTTGTSKPKSGDSRSAPQDAASEEKHQATRGAELRPQHTIDEVPAPPTAVNTSSSPEAAKGAEATENIEKNGISPESEALTAGDDTLEPHSKPVMPSYRNETWRIPAPRFPRSAQQRQSLDLLCKIWLMIAMLYRRSNMFDDSREACDEAAKCASKIETLVANTESSARAFAARGWGGSRRGSDEVWADVCCERGQLALSIAYFEEENDKRERSIDNDKVQEAVEQFEQCLMYFPDHSRGIVALSGVLLDYFEKKVELGRRVDDGKPKEEHKNGPKKPSNIKISNPVQNGTTVEPRLTATSTGQLAVTGQTEEELRKTPENLNRLAARDRAYGLLTTLTKLGSGWDDSEAWFALARAHELGGEIERAKEILWWCVELEDKRPIRHWRNVSCTGYVL